MFNEKGSLCPTDLAMYLDKFGLLVRAFLDKRPGLSPSDRYLFLEEVLSAMRDAHSNKDFLRLARLASDVRVRLSVMTGWGESENDFEILGQDKLFCAEKPPYHLEVVLDNVRSPFNVGGFFRTGDAVQVDCLHLCGITPTPGNMRVKRSSMGADSLLEWRYHPYTEEAVAFLRNQGMKIVSVETVRNASQLSPYLFKGISGIVFVFGNEEFGISHEVLRLSDLIVSLPMLGRKNSLNVTVTGGIVLYSFLQAFLDR
jgi:tRNA G18 (ribose-2'-O)-methylase SpoU